MATFLLFLIKVREMTEKLTRLLLPGATAFRGIQDWGEVETADLIAQARKYAEHLRAQADEIDEASDSDFKIDVVRGSIVQHHVRSVQPGRKKE